MLKVRVRKGKTADAASLKEITNWLENIGHCDVTLTPVILKPLPDRPLIIGFWVTLGRPHNPLET